MILLLAKSSLRDEHGEVAVLHSILLEAGVEETLNTFPNEVGEWPEDVASRDFVILDHLTLCNDLLIPLGEVLFLSVLNAKLMNVLLDLLLLLMLGSFLMRSATSLLLLSDTALRDNELGEVDYLSLSARYGNHLLHVSVRDGCGGIILHGVVSDQLEIIHQALIHDQVDLFGGVIQDGEQVQRALLGTEHGLHDLDITPTEVARPGLEVLGQPLHVNVGVMGSNHEVSGVLLLFVLQEEILRKDCLGLITLEFDLL